MTHGKTIGLAVCAMTLCATSAAQACYKHTFDKCQGAMQGAEATPSGTQSPQPSTTNSSKAFQGSGWVTTVTVNR